MLLLLLLLSFLIDSLPMSLAIPRPWPRPPVLQSSFSSSPNYPTLSSPTSGQTFHRHQLLTIQFFDPDLIATEVRFSLSNSSGLFLIAKSNPDHGRVSQQIILPGWVADGTYDFVVSENDGLFGSDTFNTDVIICTVYVGKPRRSWVKEIDHPLIEDTPHSSILTSIKNHPSRDAQHITSLLQRRAPHPSKFLVPTQDQAIRSGAQFSIQFLDGELSPGVDQARFILRSESRDWILTQAGTPTSSTDDRSLFKFQGVQIQANLTAPYELSAGIYVLLAQELYPNDPPHFEDAASVTVRIVTITGPAATNQASPPPQTRSTEITSVSGFNSPIKDQTIVTGHALNISFVHNYHQGGQVRFVLKKVDSSTKDDALVLFGKSENSEQSFHPHNRTIKARVFLPQGIPNGTYNLVAQDSTSNAAIKDLGSVQVQVQQIGPLPSEKFKPLPELAKPIQKTVYPIVPDAFSPDWERLKGPVSSQVVTYCNPKSTLAGSLQAKHRDSPSIVQPDSNQDVPLGSKFWCKVQDLAATSETIEFVLRSFGGLERPLGKAKFNKGIASLQATCPSDLQVDTYTVVARMNSIKKPSVFLDVISATVIVSHQINLNDETQVVLNPSKSSSNSAKLVKPVHNQNIEPGEIFECQLQNGENGERVKFLLRLNDGRPDLSVGSCEIERNVGKTSCQIPSSVIPGTYTLVAQKTFKKAPQLFREVAQVVITLSNPRGLGPDGEAVRLVGRSLNSIKSQRVVSSFDKAQVSTLIKPTAFQSISTGEDFDIKIKNNTFPLATNLRFLMKKLSSDSSPQSRYVLGTTSNSGGGEGVEDSVRCPDQLESGLYAFIIQVNDPTSSGKFVDSVFTPVLVVDSRQSSALLKQNSSSLAVNTNHGVLSRELPTNATTTTTPTVDASLHRVMNSTNRTMNGAKNSLEESHGRNYSSKAKKSSSVQAPVTGPAVQLPTAGPGPAAPAPATEPVAPPAPATGAAVLPPAVGPGPAASATSTGPAAAPAPVTGPAGGVPGGGQGPSGPSIDPSNPSNLVIDRSSTPLGSGNLIVDHQHRPDQGGPEHVFTNDGSKAYHYKYRKTSLSILSFFLSSSQSTIMISTIVILLLTSP